MQERILSYIRKHGLMRPGDRVGVAVSGGADSVALLRLLLEARAELGIVLAVVHFNHRIRGAEADADERFVRDMAQGFGLEFFCDSADTPGFAREHKLSLEAAGRKLRYRFFGKLTGEQFTKALDCVATAHTRDDQAETVLMRLMRGAGTRGLAGIYPRLAQGSIMRPLLEVTREELRVYLQAVGQPWREDASNTDVGFARNRVRHQMIPMLRQLNPSVEQVLSETAEIARGEEEYWQEQVRSLLPKLLSKPGIENRRSAIRLDMLQGQPLALQRRLIRALAEQHDLRLEFHQIEDLLTALRSGTSALQIKVELPQGWEAVCRSGELWFRNRCQKLEEHAAYDLALTAPREIEVAGRKIRAEIVMGSELADARAPHASETRGTQVHVTQVLLAASLAEGHLRVRNWRAGDRYWPAHTREPKKVKELLLARHIPREQKPYWPVVVAGEEIVWVPGFEAPEQFRAQETDSAALLLVSEIPP